MKAFELLRWLDEQGEAEVVLSAAVVLRLVGQNAFSPDEVVLSARRLEDVRRTILEEAAKLCEDAAVGMRYRPGKPSSGARDCAEKLRELACKS